MPVFTFEKISPPIPIRHVPTPATPVAGKPRSVIIQILDRLVETRVKRTAIAAKASETSHGGKPSK